MRPSNVLGRIIIASSLNIARDIIVVGVHGPHRFARHGVANRNMLNTSRNKNVIDADWNLMKGNA